MNVCTFSGNIGRVDDLRYTAQDQKPILGFSLAVDDGYGDSKKTIWVKCAVSGKRAESLAKIMQARMKCCVTGRAGIETWEPKSGKPGGATITLWVNELDFSGGKKDEEAQKPSAKSKNAFHTNANQIDGDDIPF